MSLRVFVVCAVAALAMSAFAVDDPTKPVPIAPGTSAAGQPAPGANITREERIKAHQSKIDAIIAKNQSGEVLHLGVPTESFEQKYVPALKEAGVSEETIGKLRDLNTRLAALPQPQRPKVPAPGERATLSTPSPEEMKNARARGELQKQVEELITPQQAISVNRALGRIPKSAATTATTTLTKSPMVR